MDFIVRRIWEQRQVGMAAAGGQRPGAGEEQPMIGIADQGHEKGAQAVVICDLVEILAVQRDLSP